ASEGRRVHGGPERRARVRRPARSSGECAGLRRAEVHAAGAGERRDDGAGYEVLRAGGGDVRRARSPRADHVQQRDQELDSRLQWCGRRGAGGWQPGARRQALKGLAGLSRGQYRVGMTPTRVVPAWARAVILALSFVAAVACTGCRNADAEAIRAVLADY